MYCDYMRNWIDHDENCPTITNITKYSNFEELVHNCDNSHMMNQWIIPLFLIEDDEVSVQRTFVKFK